jgi:hypothetical protein
MNLISTSVESYIQNSTDDKMISSTTLTVKLHSYYTKHLQPINYDKITEVINSLVKKGIVCKTGNNYSIL